MARKFLFIVAFVIAAVLAAGIAWTLFSERLIRLAMVPSAAFVEQAPLAPNVYSNRRMWIARPDIQGNPAQWTPPGFQDITPKGNAAIFFVHPTSYLDRSRWNAPLNDKTANDRAVLFVRGQASALAGAGEVWAPRYRQAAFGAFLTTEPDAQRALDAAYRDLEMAWAYFLTQVPEDRPIIVAGHSQGSLHLLRLLRDHIAGRPIAKRIVAAYVVGWPISGSGDLPMLGLPACKTPDQPGCILSWQSFAQPADPSQVTAAYDATIGFNGNPRRDTRMMCTNPINGTLFSGAPAVANFGTLIPSSDLQTGRLSVGQVSARCDNRGFLLIGPPPEGIGMYVLPGNNYHVFDYSLFWANVRADALRRLAAFGKRRG